MVRVEMFDSELRARLVDPGLCQRDRYRPILAPNDVNDGKVACVGDIGRRCVERSKGRERQLSRPVFSFVSGQQVVEGLLGRVVGKIAIGRHLACIIVEVEDRRQAMNICLRLGLFDFFNGGDEAGQVDEADDPTAAVLGTFDSFSNDCAAVTWRGLASPSFHDSVPHARTACELHCTYYFRQRRRRDQNQGVCLQRISTGSCKQPRLPCSHRTSLTASTSACRPTSCPADGSATASTK